MLTKVVIPTAVLILTPVLGGYERVVKGCVNGANIIKYTDKSVPECEQLCDANERCLAFEYGVAYGGGGGYKPRDCQLQSSSNKSGCNGGHWNLDLYIRKPQPYYRFPKGCVGGHNIQMIKNKSVQECQILCDLRDDCKAVEYGVAYGGKGSYKPRDCQLQSSANYANCDGEHHNLDLYAKYTALPAAFSPDTYRRIVKGCVGGHNIKLYKDKSVQECKDLCDARSDCKAVEYGVAYGGGGGYKPRDCQLQSSANPAGCDGGHHNLDLYVKSTYQHYERGCVNGQNIIKYTGKSVLECEKLCDARLDCKAFEYGVAYGGDGGYKPTDCQLQSGSNRSGCNGAHWNLDLYVKTVQVKVPTPKPTPKPSPVPTPAPTFSTSTYTRYARGCVNGMNIQLFKNKSVKECEALCDANPKCKAIEYGVAYGGGGSYKPRDCQLQSSSNRSGCNGGHHNLDLYVKSTYTRYPKACVNGMNIKLYRGKSVLECQKLCDADSKCKAIEYGVPYGGGGGYKEADCQLQSSANRSGCNGAHHNLDLYVKYVPTSSPTPVPTPAPTNAPTNSPTFSTSTYTRYVKGCVNGMNIQLYKNKSVKECEALCDANPKCKAVEYGMAYGGGGAYKPRDCQLQSSSNRSGCNGGHHNLDLYVKSTYTHYPKGCVNGMNIKLYKGKSVLECQKLCDADSKCKAIEYGVPYGGGGSYKEADCQLQSSANRSGCNGGHHNLDLYVKYVPTSSPTPNPTPKPTRAPTPSPTHQKSTYTKFARACVSGMNIKVYNDKSLDECEALCDAEDKCKAIEYTVSYGGGGSYKPRDCILQSGSNRSGCDGTYWNMDLYVKSTYTHYPKGCVNGMNIKLYKGKSVLECQQLCDADSKCKAIEYGVPYGGGGSYKEADCQLQSSANRSGCNGGHHNLDLYVKYVPTSSPTPAPTPAPSNSPTNSPTFSTSTYTRYAKGCVNGMNIQLYKNKSVKECEALCDANEKCKAIEYGVAYGGAGNYKPRDCQLQSSSNRSGCNGGHHNLDLYVKSTYTHYPKACVNGMNIKLYKGKSVLECQKLCDADSRCKAIEYGVPYGGGGSYKEADCQLQSSANRSGCSGSHHNLDLYVKYVPTNSPTPNPTPAPTPKPTQKPTFAPSYAPTHSISTYTRFPKGCVNGMNIQLFKNKSVKECEALCDANDKCKAIEYGVAYGGGGKYQPRDCQLQSSSNRSGCDGSHHNLDLYVKSTYTHYPKACVNGMNIQLFKGKSVLECQALCDANDKCKAIEYGVPYGGAGKYEEADCQLQSSANRVNCSGSHWNLDLYVKYVPTPKPTPAPTPAPSNAPTFSMDTYTHYPKGCVNSHNIIMHKDKSVAECKALCDADDRCKAFEYGVAYGGAGVFKPRDCQLQSSANRAGCSGGHHNLDLYVKSTYTHYPKGCVNGMNIKLFKNKSLLECQNLCDDETECKAIEYGVAYGGAGKYETADCQLQSSANRANCDGSHHNLDLYVKAIVPTSRPTPNPTAKPTPIPGDDDVKPFNNFGEFKEYCEVVGQFKDECSKMGLKFKSGTCLCPSSPKKLKCKKMAKEVCEQMQCSKIKKQNGVVTKCSGKSRLE